MAAAEGPEYPVTIAENGIKIRTEKLIVDQLYHCIYENKVFLFYKDEEGLLHCYEVENPEAVKEIAANPKDLEIILKKYAELKE